MRAVVQRHGGTDVQVCQALYPDLDAGEVKLVTFSMVGTEPPNFLDVVQVAELRSADDLVYVSYADGRRNPTTARLLARFSKG